MSFSPNLFLSNIYGKDGPAKPNRFQAIIPIPPYINRFIGNSLIEAILNAPNALFGTAADAINRGINSLLGNSGPAANPYSITSNSAITRYLSLQCEGAELPGRQLVTAEAKVYGPIYKVPYQSQYMDSNLTFICTNDFYERKLFDRWIEAIHPSDTNNLRFPKEESSRYMTDITIMQFDEFIKQIYAIQLIDAFPIAVVSQALSWSEDNFHRLTVQFAYQRTRTIYEGVYDIGAALAALGGTAAARLLPLNRAL